MNLEYDLICDFIKLRQELFFRFEQKNSKWNIFWWTNIWLIFKIIDIMNEVKNKLVIVDGYTDKTVLDMIKNLECKIILIVKN